MAGIKEETPSVKNIWILITTLGLAVLMSFLFIKIIVLLELKEYLGLVVPLLPVFYTIIYPILDGPFSSINKKGRSPGGAPIEIATPSYFRNLSLWRIGTAVMIALAIKFLMEISLYGMILFLSQGSLSDMWMRIDPALLLKLLKGDLVSSPLSMLFLEMLLMSSAGGIWLGYSSKTKPIMEGLLAGTLLSIIAAFTNITPIYAKINEMTSLVTGWSSPKLSFELISGGLVSTFFFNCWVLFGIKLRAYHRIGLKTAKRK
jgi:hypothetical protein